MWLVKVLLPEITAQNQQPFEIINRFIIFFSTDGAVSPNCERIRKRAYNIIEWRCAVQQRRIVLPMNNGQIRLRIFRVVCPTAEEFPLVDQAIPPKGGDPESSQVLSLQTSCCNWSRPRIAFQTAHLCF